MIAALRRLVCIALLWPAACLAQADGPVRLDLTWSVDGPLANVRIVPSRPIEMRIETRGREAIVRFARPIASPDAGILPRELPRFVEGVNAGFDTLLLLATQGSTLAVRREADGVVVIVRLPESAPAADADETDAIVTERAERRLERLRAALEAQTGQPDVARSRLVALEAKDPGDVDTLVQFAGLEQQIGRARRAAALLDRAVAAEPGNPDIATARTALARETSGFIRAEPEYRRASSGEKRYTVGTIVEVPFATAWRATAAFDNVLVDSPAVRRPEGLSDRFKGTRQRGALGLQHEAEDGTRTHAQLFANARTAGAGLTRDYVFDRSRIATGLELARPYWDFTESLVADGTRDRAFVQYSQPWLFGLSARARLAANRYGMPGLADGARSATFDGELRMPLDGFVRGSAVAYVMDGEYPWRIATRADPANAGGEFRPVPLRYREVHALLASYTLDWRRDFDGSLPVAADFSAGPGYDRYGRRGGPLLGFGLGWVDDGTFSGGFRANYGRGVGRDANEYSSFGGYAQWRM
ncbi:MAG: hypothetical protein HY059_01565 [Proteobacteria bacterium]|nr:hypothetical protein [Pseudomonadota bacterium]